MDFESGCNLPIMSAILYVYMYTHREHSWMGTQKQSWDPVSGATLVSGHVAIIWAHSPA